MKTVNDGKYTKRSLIFVAYGLQNDLKMIGLLVNSDCVHCEFQICQLVAVLENCCILVKSPKT